MEILIERIKQLGGFPSVTMNDVIKNVTSHALLGVPSHNPCDLLDITIEGTTFLPFGPKVIFTVSASVSTPF